MLDTHALFWWLRDDTKLGPNARALIARGSTEVLVSVASLWEASVKFRIGKLVEQGSSLWPEIEEEGFRRVPIERAHLATVETLPRHHGDPFDHIILAQALVEEAALVTSDREMTAYGVRCFPAMR